MRSLPIHLENKNLPASTGGNLYNKAEKKGKKNQGKSNNCVRNI